MKILFFPLFILLSIKTFAQHDTASYWIYKDTSNNNIDSVVLDTVHVTFFMIPQSGPSQPSLGDVEQIAMYYHSYYFNTYFHEDLFGDEISRGLYFGGCIYIGKDLLGYGYPNAIIVDLFDSLVIENTLYHDVKKMKIDSDSYIHGNYNYYFADSIGVIRKEALIKDTVVQTWNLIRHQVTFFNYH